MGGGDSFPGKAAKPPFGGSHPSSRTLIPNWRWPAFLSLKLSAPSPPCASDLNTLSVQRSPTLARSCAFWPFRQLVQSGGSKLRRRRVSSSSGASGRAAFPEDIPARLTRKEKVPPSFGGNSPRLSSSTPLQWALLRPSSPAPLPRPPSADTNPGDERTPRLLTPFAEPPPVKLWSAGMIRRRLETRAVGCASECSLQPHFD